MEKARYGGWTCRERSRPSNSVSLAVFWLDWSDREICVQIQAAISIASRDVCLEYVPWGCSF